MAICPLILIVYTHIPAGRLPSSPTMDWRWIFVGADGNLPVDFDRVHTHSSGTITIVPYDGLAWIFVGEMVICPLVVIVCTHSSGTITIVPYDGLAMDFRRGGWQSAR